MKKLIIAFNFLLLLAVGGRAQDHADRLYSVAFYNLENLFDTIHDTGKTIMNIFRMRQGWNSGEISFETEKSVQGAGRTFA